MDDESRTGGPFDTIPILVDSEKEEKGSCDSIVE